MSEVTPNSSGGIRSRSAITNPDFWNANFAQFRYRSSDLWLGGSLDLFETRCESPNCSIPGQDKKWYRRGRFNVRAGIEILIQRYGIDDRNPNLTVLFVGTSAGGYGVQHSQDILAELLPISSQAGRVRVIADGAWASPWDNLDYPWGDTWSNLANNITVADQVAFHQSLIENYGGVLLPACTTAEANPADCVLGQVSYGYSPLPTLIQKSTRDTIEMATHRHTGDPTLTLNADLSTLASWVAGQKASLATPEWLFSVDQPYHTAMEGRNFEENLCDFRNFVAQFAKGDNVKKRRLYADQQTCAAR